MNEEQRLARIDQLVDEIHELMGDEPYIFVAPGQFQTNAPDDPSALALLRDAAKIVIGKGAQSLLAGFLFGR